MMRHQSRQVFQARLQSCRRQMTLAKENGVQGRLIKSCALRLSSVLVKIREGGASESCSREIRASQIGVSKIGALQLRARQVGAPTKLANASLAPCRPAPLSSAPCNCARNRLAP